MEKLNLDRDNLKKFGIIMATVFLAIGLFLSLRHKHNPLPIYSVSLIFFMFSFVMPGFLKPVYILWMRLAFILSWINTRLLLSLIFYLIFTPIGLALKIFRVDLLDRKLDRCKESYWRKEEERDFKPSSYERQF